MDNYAGNLTPPPTFNMPNMGGAANTAFGDIGGLNQTYGGLGAHVLPQASMTAQNLYNNPYASMGLGGALTAAPMGQAGAAAQFNTGASFLPYAQQIMATGMDPQSQLYNRTLQQVQDQTRAAEGARGIQTTPYGAGLEADQLRNFNIDWQNQQLNRQTQAAGAAGQLGTTGSNLMASAPSQYLQASMLPYATFSDIGSGQFGALSGLLNIGGQGQGLAQTPIQDYLGYLGAGNQAGSVANQAFANQLNQAKLGWGQLGQLGGGIGSMLGWSPTQGGPSLGQNLWSGATSMMPFFPMM